MADTPVPQEQSDKSKNEHEQDQNSELQKRVQQMTDGTNKTFQGPGVERRK